MENKETLQRTFQYYLVNITEKKNNIELLKNPKSSILITVLLLSLVSGLMISIHINFKVIFFSVDSAYWQNFVNTSWQVHTSVLTVSVTLLIFLVQAASTSTNQRLTILKEFAKDSWLYPTLYWGLLGVIVWGVTAAFASNPIYPYISASLLSVSLINSIITILSIIFWYSSITKVYDIQWKNDIFRRLLKENIENSFLMYAKNQITNASLLLLQQKYKNKFGTLYRDVQVNSFRPIPSKKSGFLVDINFRQLEELLSGIEHGNNVIFKFTPTQFIEKGQHIILASSSINPKLDKKFLEMLTIKKGKKHEPIELILDAIDVELNMAIRENSDVDIAFYINQYIYSIQNFLKFQMNLNISIQEGFASFSPLQKINRRLYKKFKSIISENNAELFYSVSGTIFTLLSDGYHNKNLDMFRQGLILYKYLYSAAFSSNIAKTVLDRCIRIPFDILYFSDDLTEVDRIFNKQLCKEVLEYYNELFYYVSKNNIETDYLSLIHTLTQMKKHFLEQPLSEDIIMEIEALSFNWVVWLVHRFEKQRIISSSFRQIINEIRNLIHNKWHLARVFCNINTLNRFNSWEGWEDREDDDEIIKVGIQTFSGDPVALPLRAFVLYGLLLDEGTYDENTDVDNLAHYNNSMKELLEELIKKDYIKDLLEPYSQQLIFNFTAYITNIKKIAYEKENQFIINSVISYDMLINLSKQWNETFKTTVYPKKFFEKYGLFSEVEKLTDGVTITSTKYLPKQIFLDSGRPIFGLENSIKTLIEKLSLDFYKFLQSISVNVSPGVGIPETVDIHMQKLQIDGVKPHLIFVPWGTRSHREFKGRPDYTLDFNSSFNHQGQLQGCPIEWLPQQLGKKVIVMGGDKSIGEWVHQVSAEGNYLNIEIKYINEIIAKAIVRRRKNYKNKEEFRAEVEKWLRMIIVTFKTNYKFIPAQITAIESSFV